jgi:hypothetical protein
MRSSVFATSMGPSSNSRTPPLEIRGVAHAQERGQLPDTMADQRRWGATAGKVRQDRASICCRATQRAAAIPVGAAVVRALHCIEGGSQISRRIGCLLGKLEFRCPPLGLGLKNPSKTASSEVAIHSCATLRDQSWRRSESGFSEGSEGLAAAVRCSCRPAASPDGGLGRTRKHGFSEKSSWSPSRR